MIQAYSIPELNLCNTCIALFHRPGGATETFRGSQTPVGHPQHSGGTSVVTATGQHQPITRGQPEGVIRHSHSNTAV